jgi:hypothetical protein
MVSLGKWLILGLAGAFAVSALVDPARAQGTVSAFGGIGTALGSLGGGIQSLLSGVGTGTAKLFNPLFTLRDLIYGPQAGVQVEKDIYQSTATGNLTIKQNPYEVEAIQLDPAAPYTPFPNPQLFAYSSGGSISPVPVAQVMVHGQSLPLSQDAIKHYQALGVAVSPESSQTVAAQNSGNATSNRSASANYSAGAAQAAGYSTGRPRR